MANTTDVRVSADIKKVGSTDPGVLGRYTDASNYYMARWSSVAGGVCQLYKCVAGAFTQLGGDGSDINDLDTVTLVCNGTNISLEINGVVDIGPISDAAHSTGKAGIRSPSAGAIIDDFLVETI